MNRILVIKNEVFSRIVGYYRPIQSWNKGKRAEYEDRKMIDTGAATEFLAPLDINDISRNTNKAEKEESK